jgi:hypothetical protein
LQETARGRVAVAAMPQGLLQYFSRVAERIGETGGNESAIRRIGSNAATIFVAMRDSSCPMWP